MRIKYLILISVFFFWLTVPLYAKDIYVTGVTKITMRTGPGTSHKIVVMLTSGTKLEILDYQKDWSLVQTANGKSGWVLSRFLTEEVPKALVVETLKTENQRLMADLETAKEKLEALKADNAALTGIEEKYKQLKQASSDYLKLDAEYKDLLKISEDQKEQIQVLEENMNNDEKLWFLSGAGVFIVGLVFGFSTRKKKKSSLLS